MHPPPSRALAILGIVGAIGGVATQVGAQDVSCLASRSGSAFSGRCTQGDSLVGELSLHGPPTNAPRIWTGTIRGGRFRSAATSGPVGESEIGVDAGPNGALRLGRSWLRLRDVRQSADTLHFVFRFDQPELASDADVAILTRARELLSREAAWNRADTTDMETAPVKGFSCAPASRQSMFCAVYLASIEVSGEYFHFRPAANAVRQAVAAAVKRQYRHPLIDFNNDSLTTLRDVQAVLDAAISIVRTERSNRDRAIERTRSARSLI